MLQMYEHMRIFGFTGVLCTVTFETAADKTISPRGRFSTRSGAFNHLIFISKWSLPSRHGNVDV